MVVDKTKRWGLIEELSDDEEESDEEEEEEEEEELADDEVTAGIQSMSSLQTGLETPEVGTTIYRTQMSPATSSKALRTLVSWLPPAPWPRLWLREGRW